MLSLKLYTLASTPLTWQNCIIQHSFNALFICWREPTKSIKRWQIRTDSKVYSDMFTLRIPKTRCNGYIDIPIKLQPQGYCHRLKPELHIAQIVGSLVQFNHRKLRKPFGVSDITPKFAIFPRTHAQRNVLLRTIIDNNRAGPYHSKPEAEQYLSPWIDICEYR